MLIICLCDYIRKAYSPSKLNYIEKIFYIHANQVVPHIYNLVTILNSILIHTQLHTYLLTSSFHKFKTKNKTLLDILSIKPLQIIYLIIMQMIDKLTRRIIYI
jgi:hypothetical protein